MSLCFLYNRDSETVNYLKDKLKVYEYNKKIRLGINQDGGYVIGEIDGIDGIYDCYISAGVSNEESFSRDFIVKYNMTKNNSFAFDGTIDSYPYIYTEEITFFKKNIASSNSSNTSNLKEFSEKYRNIFLKMDIEGHEYEWIEVMTKNEMKKFKQIVIEVHFIAENNIITKSTKCLQKLTETHYLIHAHANNYSSVDKGLPQVVELTYINKNCFESIPRLNILKFPIQTLDFPNNPMLPDIPLDFFPFCKEPIPKVIYQTWVRSYLPDKVHIVRNRIKELNPEYKMVYYVDEEIDAFIKENFNEYTYNAFLRLNVGAAKADFWRYCILYKQGGVYLDMDSEITGSLDKLITPYDDCIITRDYSPNSNVTCNWFMIFGKNHPIMKRAIEICCNNIYNKIELPFYAEQRHFIAYLTGPEVLFQALQETMLPYYPKYMNLLDEDDCSLNAVLNKTDNRIRCRFYGFAMKEFGKGKSEAAEDLLIFDPHWTTIYQIFK